MKNHNQEQLCPVLSHSIDGPDLVGFTLKILVAQLKVVMINCRSPQLIYVKQYYVSFSTDKQSNLDLSASKYDSLQHTLRDIQRFWEVRSCTQLFINVSLFTYQVIV